MHFDFMYTHFSYVLCMRLAMYAQLHTTTSKYVPIPIIPNCTMYLLSEYYCNAKKYYKP